MVLAAGLAVLFAGALGLMVLRGKTRTATTSEAPPDAPEMLLTPEDLPRAAGSDISIFDRQDPTRLNARLLSARTDPVPERRGMVAMTEPEGWIYLRDGRAVHIRGDHALVHMPDRQQGPESGTIGGNVVISLYAAKPEATANRTGEEPEGTLATPSLTFDGNSLELSTLDRFEIESPGLSAAGEGIKLIFNEVKERLELLEIRKGEHITYRPAARARAGRSPAAQPTAALVGKGPTEPSNASGAPARKPLESFYQVAFGGGVAITQGERTLRADRVNGWARLLDKKLPENAVATFDAVPSPASERAPPTAARLEERSQASRPPAQSGAAPEPASGSDMDHRPLIMQWDGPCIVRPLDEAPPELARDHLALRASAEESGLVKFADPGIGGEGECATLDYGLTTGMLTLTGPGPASVALAMENGSSAEAIRMIVDLPRMRVEIPTPGRISAPADDAGGRRQAAWAGRAEFKLAREGDRGVRLTEAIFKGKVRATGPESEEVDAETVQAWLDRSPTGKPVLSRLVAHDPGRVRAHTARGSIRAVDVEATFKPGADPNKPDPVLLIARGSVEAQGQGSTLACGALEADLAREENGSIVVTAARIRDGFRFARQTDNITAEGNEARVDARAQIVEVIGENAAVGADRTRIAGPQIRLDGARRTVAVFGRWAFEHEGGGPDAYPVRATGTSGMTFDDATGVAEGAGEVMATSIRSDGDLEDRSTLEAERVRLELTPRPDAAPAAQGRASKPQSRNLRRVVAIGGVREAESGRPARAEVIRTDASAAGVDRRIVQALRIEAPELHADEQAGTVEAPGPGKLLVRDHTDEEKTEGGRDVRGDTLFTWDRSLHLNRASGAIELTGNTSLTHLSLRHNRVVRLIAELMNAEVRSRDETGSLAAGASGVELVRAAARGAVNATIGSRDLEQPLDREMVADGVEYDATTGVLAASAREGNVVTLFDGRRGTATSADRMKWNIATDEVEFERPRPVVIPR